MLKKKHTCDFTLIIIVIILLSIGLVMVFSASSGEDALIYKDAYYTFKRQLAWAGIGIFGMIFMMNFDYHNLRKFSRLSLFISIILLIIVLFMPERNNAHRWAFGFQPSELAKFAVVLYMANSMSTKREKIKYFLKGVMPYIIVGSFIFGLILIEPNLSVAGTVIIVVFFMLLVAGARYIHLFVIAICGAAAAYIFTISEPYRYKRLTAFLDPWKDPLGEGYQAIQSLYAIGSGGITGVGLGKSHQKFFYIPEAQNDFIFSIIGEELGLLGCVLIIILFVLLIWRGIKIALNSADSFGTLLATGIISIISVQTIINIAVATSSMPITGIPLPFISYGGSSLIFIMSSIGIVLNISRYEKVN